MLTMASASLGRARRAFTYISTIRAPARAGPRRPGTPPLPSSEHEHSGGSDHPPSSKHQHVGGDRPPPQQPTRTSAPPSPCERHSCPPRCPLRRALQPRALPPRGRPKLSAAPGGALPTEGDVRPVQDHEDRGVVVSLGRGRRAEVGGPGRLLLPVGAEAARAGRAACHRADGSEMQLGSWVWYTSAVQALFRL